MSAHTHTLTMPTEVLYTLAQYNADAVPAYPEFVMFGSLSLKSVKYRTTSAVSLPS